VERLEVEDSMEDSNYYSVVTWLKEAREKGGGKRGERKRDIEKYGIRK